MSHQLSWGDADLAVVTTYFNPARYQTRRRNYERFAAALRAVGVPLLTVESRFGGTAFELPDDAATLRTDGGDIMWQKERLQMVGVKALPASVRYVVLADADILFERADWPAAVRAAFADAAVIQPFAEVARLPESLDAATAQRRPSFAAALARQPLLVHGHGPVHGEPGIAWAARREFLDTAGVYEAAVVGSGDELFVHGVTDGAAGYCARSVTGARILPLLPPLLRALQRRRGRPPQQRLLLRLVSIVEQLDRPLRRSPFQRHYLDWARQARRASGGRLGLIDGTIRHLWHGETADRNYGTRHEILRRHGFDPQRDLAISAGGMWRWNSAKPLLHADVAAYFGARREDGVRRPG
jgi:hypothetical protein